MSKNIKTVCILLAGGKGERIGNPLPKQFLKIREHSILKQVILDFNSFSNIDAIQLVYNPDYKEIFDEEIKDFKGLLKPISGGKTRQESVFIGLKSIEEHKPDFVLIHDVARPFATRTIINNILDELQTNKAVIPAIKVCDTLKVCEDNFVKKTISRENLYQVQTPQGFLYEEILSYHLKSQDKNFTDDAAIFEYFEKDIKIVQGSVENFKITNNQDLQRARNIMNNYSRFPIIKTGIGYDVHAFSSEEKGNNNYIKLCGIEIKYSRSLQGHSDADVAIHALVDAILGALGKGDIGEHFPPSNNKFKNADSTIFLEFCNQLLTKENANINNIDLIIICEEPKISPLKNKMQKKIANVLKIDENKVNVKATTTEKLGFTGRKEGIASQAVVTIEVN